MSSSVPQSQAKSWRLLLAQRLLSGTGYQVSPSLDPVKSSSQPVLPSPTVEVEPGPVELLKESSPPRIQAHRARLPSILSLEQASERILSQAMARMAGASAGSHPLSKVDLGDKTRAATLKAKIVGKEGRNIRYFQERSGVDLVLTDDSERISLSSFDPFRREVARIALQALIEDGKIHPPRIDLALEEARASVEQEVRKKGAAALEKLGIQKVHPAVVRVLGTLHLRSSFGQNQLAHSIECAELAGLIAGELGVDVTLARRAAVFHDLGKALDSTHLGGHAKAGAEFAKKYGESDEVVNAIAAHHEEAPVTSILDDIVIAADALSGARPGARPASTEQLALRSKRMEAVALEFPGIQTAFAVQAGRELRILVRAEQVSDSEMVKLLDAVANRIRTEVEFPGEIRLTATREIVRSRQVTR
jgi:ribonuclease Y